MSFGTVTIVRRDGSSQTIAITQPTVTVGRAPGSEILLDDPAVAPQHVQILSDARSNDLLVLVSPDAVRLDGVEPEAGIPLPITSGATLTIGGATLRFTRLSANQQLIESLLAPPQRGPRVTPPLGNTLPRRAPVTPLATPIPPPPPSQDLLASLMAEAPRASRRAPAREQLLALSLKAVVDEVEPGGTAVWVVEVVNRSERIDQARLLVEGLPEAWVLVTPPAHNLAPGTAGESSIQITPPRTPESAAEIYDVAITARFVAQVSVSAMVEQALEVAPFDQFQSYPLDPQKATAWRQASYSVRVQNQSNHPQRFQLTGRDQEQLLAYRFTPEAPTVAAARTQTVQVQVQVPGRQARLLGDPEPHDFSIEIQPIGSTQLVGGQAGTLVQKPLLPRRARPIMIYGGVVLLLLSCITLALAQVLPQAQSLIDQLLRRTPTVVAAAGTATAEAIATGTAVADGQPTPTLGVPLGPSPAPSPEQPAATPEPTPDVQGTVGPQQTAAAATLTAVVGQGAAAQTAVVEQVQQTQTAAAQTQVALLTAVVQTAEANSFATQTAVAAVQQATQTQAAFDSSLTQTVTALTGQLTQTALAATQQAGVGATQTALSVGFAQTQTAASLFLTQTALAQPTAAPTATPTATPVADTIVAFDRFDVPPEGTLGAGFVHIDQQVSICMLGRTSGSELLEGDVIPAPPFTFTAALPAVQPRAYLDEPSRCRVPQLGSFGLTTSNASFYSLVVAGVRQDVNFNRSFLTSSPPLNTTLGTLGIIVFERDIHDVRMTLVHPFIGSVPYRVIAFDEAGEIVNTARRMLDVPGPYTFAVSAQRPIRAIVIVQDNQNGGYSLLSGPIYIGEVLANFTPR